MTRTIRVTGKGHISVKPDTIHMHISMETQDSDYGKAIRKADDDIARLAAAFARAGFDREELKTTSFDVEKEFNSYYDDNDKWHREFAGYKVSHRLKLAFGNDNDLLNRAVFQLAESGVDAEFSLTYTVRDMEDAKNKLLAKAISDSKSKAEIMTAAAGVKLGTIENIDYSWRTVTFESEPVRYGAMESADFVGCNSKACSFDIVADDIEADDTVTVIWEIE